MQEAIIMRVDNNFGGLNALEDLARARETKNTNSISKVKNLRSIQNTSGEHQSPKTGRSTLEPMAAFEPRATMTEIISFEEAQKVLNDTDDRALRYPNDFILAQANNKPEAVLKLIS
jgi:hypothetical protein